MNDKQRQNIFAILLCGVLFFSACGGDSDSNNDGDLTGSLNAGGSESTISKINYGNARISIPLDEIGGSLADDSTLTILVSGSVSYTDLESSRYHVESYDALMFVVPDLVDGDEVVVTVVNDGVEYEFVFAASSEEAGVGVTGSGESDDGDMDDGVSIDLGSDLDLSTINIGVSSGDGVYFVVPLEIIADSLDSLAETTLLIYVLGSTYDDGEYEKDDLVQYYSYGYDALIIPFDEEIYLSQSLPAIYIDFIFQDPSGSGETCVYSGEFDESQITYGVFAYCRGALGIM